ncbi:unnamed protein product [Prorocentrum cordatum]|uniref:PX domain-containing protein n=1 Tax=Prorocentrum cordatum TaxID=2364126 RepID=A0ABN9RS94_9DINO|nr:unnamed protein product [Polarella glacialis]
MQPIVLQIFTAVRWLHELGIAHRDLSLENVLLTHGSAVQTVARSRELPARGLVEAVRRAAPLGGVWRRYRGGAQAMEECKQNGAVDKWERTMITDLGGQGLVIDYLFPDVATSWVGAASWLQRPCAAGHGVQPTANEPRPTAATPQDALSGGRAADDWLPVLVLALSVVLVAGPRLADLRVAVSQLRRALEGPSYKGSRLRANQACRVGCSTLSREIGSLKPASVVDAEREARERQRPRQDARDGQAASLRLPLEPELMDPRTALLPGGEQNPQDGVEFRPTAAATIVVMKRCTENLLLQEQGFEALAQFCKQSPIGKSAVRQAGGMEVVVAAMIAAKLWGVGGTAVALVSALRFLAGDAAIQGGGLLATASLAAGRRHAEDAVSDAGAVPVVAAARRRHDDDAKGQPWGLAALKNLASGERECRQASCQGQVLLANIQVVSQRRKGSNVQTTVSGALAHLAGLSFAVHEEGCHVLVQLALSRASEERAICDAGAAATLARMLQNHASVAEVAKLGRDFAVTAHVERYDVVEAGGGKQIDALKARLSSSGTHVEWTIRVVGQQREPHRLRKRFNEFVTLHEFLRRRLISTPAELPSKSLVRQFNAEYLESRKVALQQYLAALCARRDAMNCPEVQRFLGLPELDVGGEAAQVAEVQEGSFGVVSVSFDAVQGLLLLGSTSASLRSKLDNAVGGMKLPWGGSQSPQQGRLRRFSAGLCPFPPALGILFAAWPP